MNTNHLKIAVVGATGQVGKVALNLLADRKHPPENLVVMASSRSIGKKIVYGDNQLELVESTPNGFEGIDAAFISVSSSISEHLAPGIVERGGLVIDDGSAFRMNDSVPLVVPEVNGSDVEWHSGIISTPNCTTTPLVMVLDALRKVSPVRGVTVSTYQAVTGTGTAAKTELLEQTSQILSGNDPVINVYPHQIAFNLLPHVDDFLIDGYTIEEMKMLNESRKILHEPNLNVSATCVRVPVPISHSEAVQVIFKDRVDVQLVTQALMDYPGISLLDDTLKNDYPMPVYAEGKDEVFVGRIRKDFVNEEGILLWLSCDNLRKGAALNALQILDEVINRDCLKPKI